MKIIVTGGHITPAIAVIEELLKTNLNYQIIFVGRKYAFEGDKTISEEFKIINNKNIPFINLITGRLQRSFTKFTLLSLIKIPIGFFQSFIIICRHKPDLILSFGGYIALPVCLAAKIMNKKIITHEQTISPGLTNRIISNFANYICLSWQESRKFFPSAKTVLTGIPIRKCILNFDKNIKPSIKGEYLYITGGSSGSRSINIATGKIIKELLKNFSVVHQCGGSDGEKDYKLLNLIRDDLPEEIKEKYFIKTYIHENEIGSIINNAKIIIGRGGANTISEIAFLGKISIIIPLPWSGSNEQILNAKMLENTGASETVLQNDFMESKLLETIDKIINNYQYYKKNSEKEKEIIIPDAAEKIVHLINENR